jgi:hypothetical protein
MLRRQLVPEPPHAEITFAHIRIVKQDDTMLGQLGPPALEIVADVRVGVSAIDVQQIDRFVREVG